MPVRLNRRHQDSVREKIRATQILNWLTAYALGEKKGKVDPARVTAALGVLKKALPDLAATELTGKDGEPILVQFTGIDAGAL